MSKKQRWEDYWKDSPAGFNEIMNQSTVYFAKQYLQHFPVAESDVILDYGCGPGFLIDFLQQTSAQFHGMDISETYINICKEKYNNNPKIDCSVTKSYDFKALTDKIVSKKVNKVIILSILQYYENTQQVENLILQLKAAAKNQPFSIVIADILPSNHQFIADVKNIIKNAWRDKYTLNFLKFILFALFSDYRKVKKNGFLSIDYPFFEHLGIKNNIKTQKIIDLTIHSSRYSVLMTF